MVRETPSDQGIDDYIAAFPEAVQARLEAVRATIRAAVPDATERISYQMPTFYLNGNLIHFGGFKEHIGLYPAPSGVEAFAADLAPYMHAKGSIRLPHDQPLPLALITRIVEYRAAENRAKPARTPKKRT